MRNNNFWLKLILNIVVCTASASGHAQNFDESVRKFITDSTRTIAFADAIIIDGTGKAPKIHQTLIIKNGLILEIGNSKDIQIPKDAKMINCSGKTIIPGLVMLHEHLFYTIKMGTLFNAAEMPYSFPQMYLAGGATTIRTGGSIEPQTDLSIKNLIDEGNLIGPDIDVTAPYIERKGLWNIPSTFQIKDSSEAAAMVNFWADRGCTSFKMYVHATKEDLIAVVREAHKRHLKVTGHIGTITYREAAELGIDNLEHGFMASSDFDAKPRDSQYDDYKTWMALGNLDVKSKDMRELIQYLVDKHVAITSTLPVFKPVSKTEVVLGGGDSTLIPFVSKLVNARWKRMQTGDSLGTTIYKKDVIWEKQFYDAGGLLVCGTDPTGDGMVVAGYGSRSELELLVEGGFSAVQAIQIATLNGAKYLGREKLIGSLEPGKRADLVLIDGDLQNGYS